MVCVRDVRGSKAELVEALDLETAIKEVFVMSQRKKKSRLARTFSKQDLEWIKTAPRAEVYEVAKRALLKLKPRELLAVVTTNEHREE